MPRSTDLKVEVGLGGMGGGGIKLLFLDHESSYERRVCLKTWNESTEVQKIFHLRACVKTRIHSKIEKLEL